MSASIYYDPFDTEIDREATHVWGRMRDEAPLYRNDEHDFWALSRYDDILTALLDVDTYLSGYGTTLDLMSDKPFAFPMFIFRDPPDHTLMRKLVSRSFTPRAIAGLEPRVEATCAELLDPLEDLAVFDYVEAFASLLPPTVILALLGFPSGFERDLRESMDATLAVTGEGRSAIDEAGNVGAAVFDLLPEECAKRRTEPTDDLLTVLANHELELADGSSRPLTNEEIHGYVALIAGAGAETVARMLGWAAVLLADHPDQRRELRENESLIPNAIEEILRFEAPSPVQGRRLASDVEWYGSTLPAGAKVLLLNGSGNRDERHFDDPDTFDIHRVIDRHLSFGYGAHFCIGSALARLEGRIALEQTLRRFPEWDVDVGGVEWVHTSTVRGYSRVPIEVTRH